METRTRWAFILDQDEFVRLSLNKILKKYGFRVEEIDDLSELEKRKREVKEGVILADVEIEVLERWLPFVKKWGERFILISPLITDEINLRLKKIGIRRILKKPVEPRILRRMIRGISFPDGKKVEAEKRGESYRFDQKGGEGA